MLPHVKDGDWRTLRQIIQKIGGSKLGPTANVTFNSLTLIDYLTVGGDATVAGTLGVTGDASFAANVAVTGVINLGHASDTTLARVSAGDVNIEGNIIYRAGGTDVPVTDGGTGVSSLTDHGLLLGSGTSAVTVLAEASNGQLPIGSTGADPSLATLTGTAKRVTVTNGAGSITLSGPQDLDIVDTPSFVSTTLTDLTASRLVYGDADKRLGSVALGAGLDLTGSTLKCDGVLEDLDTLGAVASDSQMIVGSGAGTFAYESGATLRTSIGVDAAGTASGLVSTHESTYNHSQYNTAYSHSQLASGNPHSVTPTELSLLIGTNTQAWDANLDQIAALAVTDSNLMVGNGSAWVAESGATLRTSIGVDAAGTASGLISTHESTYNHSNYNTAYSHVSADGSSHTFLDQSVTVAASPAFAGISVASDTDYNATIGRASIGYGAASDWAGFAHLDMAGTLSQEALIQNSVGQTTLNAASGQLLQLHIAGVNQMSLNGTTVAAAVPISATNLTSTGLTASRLVYGDASKQLGSVTLGAGLDLTGSTLKCDGLLEDLDSLGASSSDGEIIVATGAGTLAWESGGTARTSLGLGAGDSPTLTGLDLTGITDGYIPYVGASGLAASSLFSDGNNAGFKVTSFDPWGWYIAQAFAFPNGCYNTARTDATPAMYTGTNSYLSGTNNRWEYHKAHFASQYIQQSGAHYYNAAVSGASAGDAITWKPLLGLTLSETVFNDGSEDIDFRVESDASTHAIFMEGSSSNVGFSVSSPQEDVHAADTVRADTFFNHNGTDGATGAITVASTTTINVAGGIITGWT